MSCTFIFVREHLHAIGTTRAAAIRNARREAEFDPTHHDVTIIEATRGAYDEVQSVARAGTLGRAVYDADLGKYALPRR